MNNLILNLMVIGLIVSAMKAKSTTTKKIFFYCLFLGGCINLVF